jgi:hypothetical protein
MTCSEIKYLIPAHREDILSPEDKLVVLRHIASCLDCRQALTDLEKSGEVLHGLEEVEPPPFFEQRIMSRVREENGKKQRSLRKLFYPLHIKVPIQAMATLLIAVFGIYVYQRGEPDMKQMAPLPLPVKESGQGKIAKNSTGSIAAISSKRNGHQFTAVPDDAGADLTRTKVSPPPIPKESSTDAKSDSLLTPPSKKDVPQIQEESLNAAPQMTIKQEVGQALETPLPQEKRKDNLADMGAASGVLKKPTYVPAPPKILDAKTRKRSVVELTIHVGDMSVAVPEIENRLVKLNARIIARKHIEESESWEVEMPAQNVPAFLDQIEAIGRVTGGKRPVIVQDGSATISLRITSNPKDFPTTAD